MCEHTILLNTEVDMFEPRMYVNWECCCLMKPETISSY